jgi:hypothetical protein
MFHSQIYNTLIKKIKKMTQNNNFSPKLGVRPRFNIENLENWLFQDYSSIFVN